MKNFMKILLGIGLISTFGSGCVTRGENFSSDYTWVKAKATKKTEVVKTLGQPFSVGYSAGRPTWTYGFYKFRLFGQSQTKELKLYWDKDTVDSFSFNSSFKEDRVRALNAPK